MDEVEKQVQKNIVNFCKSLPQHVESWRLLLQESVKPLQNLINVCEQRRHVSRAKLNYIEDFENVKATLLFYVSARIEEELTILKEIIEKLNKSTHDLRNKLFVLERSTLNLNWDEKSELISGSGSQPSLARLLEDGLSFFVFFSKNAKVISDQFKVLDFDDEKSISGFRALFTVNLESSNVTSLLALTQYVDNAKSIL